MNYTYNVPNWAMTQMYTKSCANISTSRSSDQAGLLKQYPNYVVELLLQLTCCVEGTSGDDSSSWLRAVILYQ